MRVAVKLKKSLDFNDMIETLIDDIKEESEIKERPSLNPNLILNIKNAPSKIHTKKTVTPSFPLPLWLVNEMVIVQEDKLKK